jgi:ribosomal subunit interface protein
MQVYLTARQLDFTSALRGHVSRHIADAVRGHTNVNVTRMEIQLYKLGDREVKFGCHVLLEVSPRHEINVREEDHDLYEAIDLAQKRVLRALTDYRDRRLTVSRRTRKYSISRLVRALGFSSRSPGRT